MRSILQQFSTLAGRIGPFFYLHTGHFTICLIRSFSPRLMAHGGIFLNAASRMTSRCYSGLGKSQIFITSSSPFLPSHNLFPRFHHVVPRRNPIFSLSLWSSNPVFGVLCSKPAVCLLVIVLSSNFMSFRCSAINQLSVFFPLSSSSISVRFCASIQFRH